MRCENCNAENAADAEYCAGCGERLLYDEAFFKRENKVDALPKLGNKVKPIRAFRKSSWRVALVQQLFKSSDGGDTDQEPQQARRRANAEMIVAFCIFAALLTALFVTRVLR